MTWNLTPGATNTYITRYIEGQFNPNTGEIGITHADDFSQWPIVITNCAVNDWPASRIIGRHHHRTWEPSTPPRNPGTLYAVPWKLNGQDYIGELGYDDTLQTPPIPVYRNSGPTVWDMETGVQRTNSESKLPCRHYIGIDATPWGPGCERVALWERGIGGPQCVYNYVFNAGGDIIDQWYGVLDTANYSIQGMQYYRI